MSESPWKSSASSVSTGTPAASPPANWGMFLLINIGLAILVGVINYGLMTATGTSLPDLVVNLAVLVASTWFAGKQWLGRAGGAWTSRDRHKLAFAYTMVNLVMTVLGLLLIFGLLSAGLGGPLLQEAGLTPEILSAGLIVVGVIMVIVVPLVLWACYGIMRLVLAHMVGGLERTDAADTFS